MTGGAADLEAELAQRQQELEADMAKHAKRTANGLSDAAPSATDFDPTEVVSKMKVYLRPQSAKKRDASKLHCPCSIPALKAGCSALWIAQEEC